MSPAGMVTCSTNFLASSILAPGGGFLYKDTTGLPVDLLGTSTKICLNFSQIPEDPVVYFFQIGTGPPDMLIDASCGGNVCLSASPGLFSVFTY